MNQQNKSLITPEEVKLAAKEIIIHQEKEVPLVESINLSLEESGIGAELQSLVKTKCIYDEDSCEEYCETDGLTTALCLAFHLGFVVGVNKGFQFTPTPKESKIQLH